MNDCKNKNYISEKVYHKSKANANINSEILFVFSIFWTLAHVYVYKKWISHVEYDVNKEILDCKQQ